MIREIAAEEAAAAEEKRLANAIYAETLALEGQAVKTRLVAEVNGTFITTASAAASATGRLGAASGATRGGIGNLQQSIVAGSYAFQDFTATSGDLGAKLNSITNNLPTLLIGLGGIGIALSVAATAGVAVYRNWDQIAGLWETRSPFPKAASDIGAMKRELDSTKESLEKFEKAGTGNVAQLEAYNKALARTVELEKRIADEEERQQLLKKSLEGKTEEQEGRGKAYEEATKGRGKEYLDEITEAYRKDLNEQIRNAKLGADLAIDAFNQENHTEAEKRKFAAEQWKQFQDTVRIVRGNDPASSRAQIARRTAEGPGDRGQGIEAAHG